MDIVPIKGVTVAFYDGPVIAREADANDAIGACYGQEVDLIAIPVEKLVDDFFWLSTGLAGAILQKCTNYNQQVAIVGNISAYTAKSAPLRDFVYESNKRGEIRFVATEADL